MVNASLIQQLKQSNISKDGEKTGKRVQEVWKAASSSQKAEICDLSGSAKATVYRIFKTGGISAKLAIALGQVLRVDPRYLTGEADAPGDFLEAEAVALLSHLGYDRLLGEQEKAVRRAQREAARVKKEEAPAPAPVEVEEAPEPVQEAEPEAPAVPPPAEPAKPAAKEVPANEIVTNDDILVLLRSLEIRAKAGIPEAKRLLNQIKLTLLGL